MRATRVSAFVFAAAASLAGCAGSGEVRYAGQVNVTSPDLVYVEPGVQVVADADEPLFFADNYYWLYRDGYWMRSDNYRNGFVRVELSYVPERIRVIDRPQTYVQYRRHMGRDRAARNQPMPTRTRPAPYPSGTYNQNAPAPAPDEWQRPDERGSRPDHERLPTNVNPTPPITSPNDVHGTPMPPHQVPPNADRTNREPGVDRIPPGQERRPQSDAGNGSTIDSEHGNDHRPTPPGQAGRPGPQAVPPASEPARDDNRNPADRDHGNAPDRDDHSDRGNGHESRSQDRNDRVDTHPAAPATNPPARGNSDKSQRDKDKRDKRDRKDKQ